MKYGGVDEHRGEKLVVIAVENQKIILSPLCLYVRYLFEGRFRLAWQCKCRQLRLLRLECMLAYTSRNP